MIVDHTADLLDIHWLRPSSAKRKDKSLKPKFGLRPNLRLNLTSRQRLGLRIFLNQILVLDFCLSCDLCQENC